MDNPRFSCSRRTFLLGAATTVAGAALAACGTEASEEVAATEVPVGSAVFVGNLIIAQPKEGEFLAYSRTCPHQGNTIDEINGDTVTCTAHNSTFSIEDGSVVDGVARDPLQEGTATEEGGTVTATA
ncbi:iron-sulfur protein [Corynebacterium yudongzhengii]|uniref:Rieske (2Fe-2S) protein n=1 Tax=Corynebacterium yudongzhengii TaxID=2080740 RepID=A0A2U1T4X9_9CORY|nr:Rieske (2Fe-2S) protein [Corynebacterium yudongzhengii]AWB82867.1 iron-sulfur protein [Corynebacterium yudongzhengii]PWC00938.1 Rieske (2Fe-2S) protein [Corynebacterium yudongzhengii]